MPLLFAWHSAVTELELSWGSRVCLTRSVFLYFWRDNRSFVRLSLFCPPDDFGGCHIVNLTILADANPSWARPSTFAMRSSVWTCRFSLQPLLSIRRFWRMPTFFWAHVHFCRSLPCLHPPFYPQPPWLTQRFWRMPPNICGDFLLMPILFELSDQLCSNFSTTNVILKRVDFLSKSYLITQQILS